MKPIKNINSKDSHQLMSGIQRQSKLEQGFFDGRFRTRAVLSKKTYTRKIKHKNNQ